MWDSAYTNPLGLSPEEGDKTPDQQTEAFIEAARARYEYCLKIAKRFKGPDGQEILKIWRQNTIESAAWMPSLAQHTSIEAANAHAYAREGQNAFVRDIEQCIEIANKCKTLDDFCAMINQVGTVNQI
ncbi:MAG: hypothetical protein ACPGQQ_00785 [Candidatus Puniceispirillaceae bacterium]